MKAIETMGKRKSHAFGKDVYLLGKRNDGTWLWLKSASWDCDWYWGFGYIETYTNNTKPEASRDIKYHTHWDTTMGKQETYNPEKQCFRVSGKYIHHLNENPDMKGTVLTDKESWELADLMKTFYTLKDTAALFHTGNSHLNTGGLDLKNKDMEDLINKTLMPQVFARIYQILTK